MKLSTKGIHVVKGFSIFLSCNRISLHFTLHWDWYYLRIFTCFFISFADRFRSLRVFKWPRCWNFILILHFSVMGQKSSLGFSAHKERKEQNIYLRSKYQKHDFTHLSFLSTCWSGVFENKTQCAVVRNRLVKPYSLWAPATSYSLSKILENGCLGLDLWIYNENGLKL